MRSWTSSDGITLTAKFIEQIGAKVKIINSAGKEFLVPLNRFSKEDQKYVEDLKGMLKKPLQRNSRIYYLEDEKWDGYRKGGVLVTAVSGRVETKAPLPKLSTNIMKYRNQLGKKRRSVNYLWLVIF